MSDHVPGQVSKDGAFEPTTGDSSGDFGEEGAPPLVTEQLPPVGDEENAPLEGGDAA